MQRIVSSIFCVLVILVTAIPVAKAAPPATGGYIVVLHNRAGSPGAVAEEITQEIGGRVGFIYEHALRGFSITLPPQAVAALKNNPNVKYVATDDIRYASAQTLPTGIQRIFADVNSGIGIDGVDDLRVDVDVAVIDTGIDFEHPDLNVVGGINCAAGNFIRTKCVDGGDDDHYHGTHVAGTIGAIDNGIGVVGVAPGARLWAVKVLNSQGSGYSSWIIAGIDWVTARADFIKVANMSLSGHGFNQAEYDAIQGAVNAGVAFAVAAGNDDDDAVNYSPAAFANVLTVSALADFDGIIGGLGSPTCRTDQDDTLADFSNWGDAVDIAAPGVCIESTFPLEYGGYGTISGTSMASPHVAGALALLASGDNKPSDADDVYDLYNQIKIAGNFNWIDDSGDNTKEPLLDVSKFMPVLVSSGGPSPNTPPNVSISSPKNGDEFDANQVIAFSGNAFDKEDGDLTDSLVWLSNLDAEIGTGGSFSRELSDGIHTIVAEVTDKEGQIGTDSITITVNTSSGGDITLEATAKPKNKVMWYVDLEWSGAMSQNVDVYRDQILISTTANDGAYTDNSLGKGGGSATYRVCEAGTTTCSNSVFVSW